MILRSEFEMANQILEGGLSGMLKSMSPSGLHDLIKTAQEVLIEKDKATKIQMRVDPKPKYIKPGTTGKGLNKKGKDAQSDLEKLNKQIEACKAQILKLGGVLPE